MRKPIVRPRNLRFPGTLLLLLRSWTTVTAILIRTCSGRQCHPNEAPLTQQTFYQENTNGN
jgi:hypothetical protein